MYEVHIALSVDVVLLSVPVILSTKISIALEDDIPLEKGLCYPVDLGWFILARHFA